MSAAARLVPLQTLDGAVRLCEELAELTDPHDFVATVLPALADLVGCDRATYHERGAYARCFRQPVTGRELSIDLDVAGVSFGALRLNRAHRAFDDIDVAVLDILRRPMINALLRARIGANAGAAALTGRELAVLQLVSRGSTNRAIGRAIGVSPRTVAKHLEHIYRKLDVSSRAAAVASVLTPDRNC